MVWIIDGQNVRAEARHHEELLEERDHVADAAEVLQANIACCRLLVVKMGDAPVALFVCPPRSSSTKVPNVIKDKPQVIETVAGKH